MNVAHLPTHSAAIGINQKGIFQGTSTANSYPISEHRTAQTSKIVFFVFARIHFHVNVDKYEYSSNEK